MATDYAIIAGGCFWCTEAIFKQIRGVTSVESGYTGGHTVNPDYQQVCQGDTGHAEAVRLGFDSQVVSYDDLLDIHFATHDPTQLNRQGNDIGPQYRSALFPDEHQKEAARAAIIRAQQEYAQPLVTTIEDKATWYPAENYHQNYWEGEGQENRYCLAVIPPKLQRLRQHLAAKIEK